MKVCLWLLLFTGLMGLRGAEARRPVIDIDAFFVSSDRRMLVERAESLEAILLVPRDPHATPPSEQFADYIIAKRVMVPAELKAEIQALLTSPGTYRWPDKIMPDGSVQTSLLGGWYGYHVRLTFRCREDTLDFGISCRALISLWQKGTHVNTALYGDKHDRVFEIFRAMFPDDARLLRLDRSRQWIPSLRGESAK